MTNYHASAAFIATLFAGACVAAAPADTGALPRYTQAPGTGSLTFDFVQAGAESRGSFRKFETEMQYGEGNLPAGSLKVTVQIGSLDTQDKDRDEALAGPDLFDVKKFPTAQFVADSFAKRADGGLEAVGKLTLRGVTRDLRVPLNLRVAGNACELSGELRIRRLDFGVGQGEWQSTEWVGDEVKLHYKVPLARSR